VQFSQSLDEQKAALASGHLAHDEDVIAAVGALIELSQSSDEYDAARALMQLSAVLRPPAPMLSHQGETVQAVHTVE